MNNKYRICPESEEWLSRDDAFISGYFDGLGFRTLQDILDMRVFDLMNMRRIDPIRTEEIITALYHFLNPNMEVDEAMYQRVMIQPFDLSGWRKRHKDLSTVTVSDLVLTEDINLAAIQHFYDAIRKKFFKSDEYNWREYRYWNWKDYRKQNAAKRGKEKANASEI